MNKLYISIAILLTFVGCTKVFEETSKYDKDCILLNVYNGPMKTKATNEGTEYERQINRLDCFFYVKGALNNCVYYQKVTNNDAIIGQQEIPFFVDESVINTIFPGSNSECDVFVIANYPGTDDWATKYQSTSVESLKMIVLDLFEKESDGTYKHDAVNKPFVMSGFYIATKGNNNNATGTIPLVRAASKITIKLKIPEWLDVTETVGSADPNNTGTQTGQVRYYPVVKDTDNKIPFKTVFHNGVSKTYLNTDYNDELVDGSYPDGDYFSSPVTSYKNLNFTDGATDEEAGYYTCEIEVPFYSYARTWAKGANNAPYLTVKMPWKKTVDETEIHNNYYYQILVNAGGLSLSPNSWYDLTVNVGVLGSLTESLPQEIKSDDITYYILDWTKEPQEDEGDRYEDVVIKEYMYLVVPEKEIVINNSNIGYIPFDASHNISWKMNTTDTKKCDILPTTTVNVSFSSFYVNCGTTTPTITKLDVSASNFSLDAEKPGYLKYEYEIPEKVYSPVYVYVTITMTVGDKTFSENVRIVQYPPIYLIPDASVAKSVYVNNNRNSSSVVTYHNIKLGGVGGGSGTNYMYIVNVSSFKEDDTFTIDGKTYNYVIGDPRQTEYNNYKSHSGYDFTDDWVTAPATYENSEYVNTTWTNQRILTYYQPTSSEPNVINVIAPKFRVVSFNSTVGGQTNVSKAGGPLRCATYQEDGFPAGRWRVPTAAEIFFIAKLQAENSIVDIFQSGDQKYYCSTGMVSVNNGNPTYYEQANSGTIRCVYDEWYWGSEREAKRNPSVASDRAANSYLFTWGDEPRR